MRRPGELYPRTTSYPMRLSRYVEREKHSRVVDDARLTPEWKAWHDRMVAQGKDRDSDDR